MNPTCKQCGQREVEDARVCYATPVCFACLPPPRPLNAAWSLSAVWLADMAEALEHVRHEDSAPKLLTPEILLGLVNELREDRDDWKKRAESAERLADERLAHANQLQADIEAEQQGRLALRKRLGAREDETMGVFLERLATMAGVVPADVHESGWQWRPTDPDTAFAPPFGTIRVCRACGCLVAGGRTACSRCVAAEVAKR